jgi:hypothetical protein
MNLLKRIKNLWRISEYRVEDNPEISDKRFKSLTKDVLTIQKKPATIILPDRDILTEDIQDDNTN